jgi:hypothetical protein
MVTQGIQLHLSNFIKFNIQIIFRVLYPPQKSYPMKRFPLGLILLFALCFVGFGDQVLPKPIGKYSTVARIDLDNMLVSAFPSWRPKTNPYGRTEDAIRQTENR